MTKRTPAQRLLASATKAVLGDVATAPARTPEEAAAAWERHREEEERFTHSDQYAHMRQTEAERREAERRTKEGR
jgi:hypothetical protein